LRTSMLLKCITVLLIETCDNHRWSTDQCDRCSINICIRTTMFILLNIHYSTYLPSNPINEGCMVSPVTWQMSKHLRILSSDKTPSLQRPYPAVRRTRGRLGQQNGDLVNCHSSLKISGGQGAGGGDGGGELK
jgi:hypothetical protein